MSFSVNTNNGAAVALQYLTATQGQLNKVQSAINSGMKVANARDDGAIYAIAQNQRGAVAGYTSVINSINNGTSAIDVALSCLKNSPIDPTEAVLATTQLSALPLQGVQVQ